MKALRLLSSLVPGAERAPPFFARAGDQASWLLATLGYHSLKEEQLKSANYLAAEA